MARRHKMEVGGLNVRVHPHSEDIYRDLIHDLYKLRRIAKIHGDRHGLITTLDRRSREPVVGGIITTFLEIDSAGEWFNTETMKEASDNEIEAIVIPDNLRPNAKSFRFQFDVVRHELVFEHYSEGDVLTHNSALKFFKNLTNVRSIGNKFGLVDVNIIQSRGSAEKIFSIPRITDLEILIEKPNADIWGEDFEEQAEEHLDEKNARSMRVSYKSEAGQGIRRDVELEALIRASVNNGRSVAKGYGPNGHLIVSTDSYPRVEQETYEPDEAPSQVFARLARIFRR
ncbi:MAG: DUF4747 family protein [Porphyrobacter sp.]|nr:DUF4747 family protein [Porphyrobacter sp.]